MFCICFNKKKRRSVCSFGIFPTALTGLTFFPVERDASLYSIQKQLEFRFQPRELPGILRVSPDTWATDISAYQSIRGSIQTENANVDQYVLQTTHFRAWLSSKYSDVLGILDIFVDGEVSPLSTFTATLLLSLQRLPLFPTLSYFCQPHTSDHLAGGWGLLRSLISQLSAMVTLDGLPRQETLASCQSLPGLMDLFEKLLATLADVAVFCVIDGIHFCESNHVFAEEFDFVLTRLTHLASTSHPRIVFKLLVTGNGSNWFFKDRLSVSKQLLIEEDFAKNQEDTTEELISAELAWQMGNRA